MIDLFKENKKETLCYACIIHNRLISAIISPVSYPVEKFAVAFCGRIENKVVKCQDDGTRLVVKITDNKLYLKLDSMNVQMDYEKEKMIKFQLPIYDAMESWEFFISDSQIDCERLKPGYRKGIDGIYYNIEDEKELERKMKGYGCVKTNIAEYTANKFVSKKENVFNIESIAKKEDKFIGKVIKNIYFVQVELSSDGILDTYLVQNINDHVKYVMKIYDKTEQNYSSTIYEKIMQKYYMIKSWNHPSIPHIIDVSEEEQYIFILQEYVEGISLETLVKNSGPQSVERVIEWGKQLCDIFCYIHSLTPPFILGNLTPSNIIWMPNGQIKIIHLEAYFSYEEVREEQKNKLLEYTCIYGVMGYCAPEEVSGFFAGDDRDDSRTDIYRLGMTMHYLITGRDPRQPPYIASPICNIDPNLPKGLEYIISKCIQMNPQERYQSCYELRNDLDNYMLLPKRKGFFAKFFKRN